MAEIKQHAVLYFCDIESALLSCPEPHRKQKETTRILTSHLANVASVLLCVKQLTIRHRKSIFNQAVFPRDERYNRVRHIWSQILTPRATILLPTIHLNPRPLKQPTLPMPGCPQYVSQASNVSLGRIMPPGMSHTKALETIGINVQEL